MASPQRENGHIDFANEIAEHLAYYRLSGQEYQILWVIWRKTYGWQKKQDAISLSQFFGLTKMKKPSIIKTINKLVSKNIVSKKANAIANLYSFNKDFDTWKALAKRLIVSKKANRSLAKRLHTKDTITKDNIINTKFSALAIKLLVETMGMSAPDGDYKFNNIFPCKTLKKRIMDFLVSRGATPEQLTDEKILDQLKVILNNAKENDFWGKSITSISFLVKNFNKILNLSL